MKVNCEKCGAAYDIEDQQIPDEGLAMKCPSCLGSFRVERGASPPADGEDAGAAMDLAKLKFFIRRHTGSVFGPFAGTAVQTMATSGKLDGSEHVSLDNETWDPIASHPAFAGLFDAADEPEVSSDLPAPKPAGGPAAGPPVAGVAITPPPPGGADLPAPKPAGGPAAGPPVAGVAITPPPPDLPDLPAPKPAGGPVAGSPPVAGDAIAPPPPDLPDLPAPKLAGGPAASAPLTPPPPDLPDLPTPAQPNLPTPKEGPGAVGGLDLPDLPTPAQPDLPTPAQPNLPTPKEGFEAGGPDGIDLPELPTPSGSDLPTPAQPDLPTPQLDASLDAGEDSMSYGEVSLDDGEPATPGTGDPLDLSELDLLTPKADAPADAGAVDLVAPVEDRDDAGPEAAADIVDQPSPGAEPSTGEGKAKPKARSAAGGDKLLGLPKKVAFAVLGVVGLAIIAGAAFAFWPKAKPAQKRARAGGDAMDPTPSRPRPSGDVKVGYLPAMDLDTYAGYQDAAKAHRKRLKQHKGNATLRAARAKAWLCAAYRFHDPALRKRAEALLKKTNAPDDVEVRKAKALRHLLRDKPKKARAQLKKARKQAKDDPEVHLFLGWTELAAGKPDKAEKAFRKALKLRRESAGARFGLVQALQRRDDAGTRAERLRLLGRILKLSKKHAEAWVARMTLEPPADPAATRKKLKQRLAELGDEGAARERTVLEFGLATLLLRGGQLDKALPRLAKITKAFPKEVAFLYAEGRARLGAGHADLARIRLKAALDARPAGAPQLEALVRAYLALGQLEEADDAMHAFEKRLGLTTASAAGKDPDDAMAPKRLKKRKKKKARKKGGKASKSKKGAVAKPQRPPHLLLARGRLALAQEDTKKAKRLFLRATNRAPAFTDGHVAYLELLLAQRRYEGMKSVLEILRPRYADGLPNGLRLQEGRMLMAQQKPEAARKVLRAALDRDPGANHVALDLALCLWRSLNKPEEGYLILERVFKRAASLTRAVQLIAEYHFERREVARGLQRFKVASKTNRSVAFSRLHAGFLLRHPTLKRLKLAETLLTPLLKDNPRDHGAIALLALVELGRGSRKPAQKRIQRALILQPKNVTYLKYQARIYAQTGDPRRAVEIYNKLLKTQPKSRELLTARTRILCQFRDTKRCLAGAKALLKLGPSADAYILEGQAFLQKRRAARAIKAFRKAVAQDRQHAQATFLLGRTLYDEASFRKAISGLRRCLELADEGVAFWPDAHYFLGMAYAKVKSRRLAQKHLKVYLGTKGNPQNPESAIQRRTATDLMKRL